MEQHPGLASRQPFLLSEKPSASLSSSPLPLHRNFGWEVCFNDNAFVKIVPSCVDRQANNLLRYAG